MGLISSFSILGLGNSLIKYLPASDKKTEKINTSFAIVGLASIMISLFFIVFLNFFSPKLLFVRENIFFAISFVILVVFYSFNTLIESIFISYRSTIYILIKNAVASAVKLVFPLIFVAIGSYGIFISFGLATSLAFVIGAAFLILNFSHTFMPAVDKKSLQKMIRFSLGNYAGNFIGNLPAMALPLLITNSIGANFAAYFYMDMMIANLLFIIPSATTQSLFAEGSLDGAALKSQFKKTFAITFYLLTPAILATLFLGKYFLFFFGKDYSGEGILLLQMLTVSAIFLSINYAANVIFCIKHRIKMLILVNLFGASLILALSALLMRHDLIGIGIAWLLGQAAISAISLPLIKKLL